MLSSSRATKATILPGFLVLPILLLVLATATPTHTSSSRLRGTVCFRRITQVDTYLQPVRYTQLVRTRKCTLLIFCKTAYRTRESYRMERKTRTTYKMRVECCEGHHEVNGICVPDPTHNTPKDYSYLSTADNMSSSWNSTEAILIGKNKELHITDSNQTTIIIAFIGCILSVFIIIVVVVIYRRRKKAAKYIGEIPYTPDVLPLPSKSKKDGAAPQEGINYRNFPATDENFYMSMDSGCSNPVPSVKVMLATRGSGYRFSGIEEEPRRRADTLYVVPDSVTYNNHNNPPSIVTNCPDPKFPKKTDQDKGASDIYINGQDINATGEDEENIYSEIKAKNFRRVDPSGDENGYSFIRMECVKESSPPEDTESEAETALYSSLHECNNGNATNGTESVHSSKQADGRKVDNHEALTQAKRRENSGRQTEDNETETRDDACDSGIYTSINLDSDKDDEANLDTMYDQPKNKIETKRNELQQAGTDFYENCRRDSNESNYDIPRSQKEDEEDAIYSEISSSSQINTSVTAHTS